MRGKPLDWKRLGNNVRRLRVEKGYTQKDMACQLGCSQRHLSRIERGEGGMSVEIFVRICSSLDCKPADILYGAE